MTVQFRFPDERQTTRVRALIGWDAPGTTAAELQVTRIECKGSNSSRPTA
jgi:hypothetical protein